MQPVLYSKLYSEHLVWYLNLLQLKKIVPRFRSGTNNVVVF
jgi:hypothetical protein